LAGEPIFCLHSASGDRYGHGSSGDWRNSFLVDYDGISDIQQAIRQRKISLDNVLVFSHALKNYENGGTSISRQVLGEVMKFSYAKKKILNFEYQRNLLLGLTAILLAIIVILSLYLLLRSEKTIILPPEVRREFWAAGNRFSPEYLEEQAVYVIHLALDVNQMNYPYNTEILMRYADAETCAHLKEKFEKTLKTLKKNNASTQFEVKDATVFPDQNIVHVKGILNCFVGSKRINSYSEIYEVKFKTFRGRLFLKDFQLIEGKRKHEE
jgi:type IV conjugative transfer system protein TraE